MTRKKGRILILTPNLNGLHNGINRIQPPLGPMIAASVIREQFGHDVYIHDTALAGWSNQRLQPDGKTVLIGQDDQQIADEIKRYDPDVIGISVLFTNLAKSSSNIADIAKSVRPNVPVVMGGNYVSNSVGDVLYARRTPGSRVSNRLELFDRNRSIDYLMHGEVDMAWPALADALIQGESIDETPGLVRRGVLDYIINPKVRPVDVRSLPIPARDLVDMGGYFNIGAFHSAKSKSSIVLPIMASRGCPESCSFCTTPETWGNLVRWRDIGSIVAEIQGAIATYGIKEIQFEDDTITANAKMLYLLTEQLERLGLPWCTPNGTKVNYHQESKFKEGGKQLEMYKRMAGSGCYQITLACESGVQDTLDRLIGKKLSVNHIKPAIVNAKNAGMLVHTFWTIGYPRESRASMEETIEFARSSGADSYSVAIVTPNPGTRVYRQVVDENLWWPGLDPTNAMFRNSLIRVDGFSSPAEFERWVAEKSVMLNQESYDRDPSRFQGMQGIGEGARVLNKDKYFTHQT